MPTFIVNASCKIYFDKEIAVEAASEDDAVSLVQEMVRAGQVPMPQLPDEVDGWEVGEDRLARRCTRGWILERLCGGIGRIMGRDSRE